MTKTYGDFTYDQYYNDILVTDETTGLITRLEINRDPATEKPVISIRSEDSVHVEVELNHDPTKEPELVTQ